MTCVFSIVISYFALCAFFTDGCSNLSPLTCSIRRYAIAAAEGPTASAWLGCGCVGSVEWAEQLPRLSAGGRPSHTGKPRTCDASASPLSPPSLRPAQQPTYSWFQMAALPTNPSRGPRYHEAEIRRLLGICVCVCVCVCVRGLGAVQSPRCCV